MPNGPALARSVSTWIHWLSSVASANLSIWSWVIVTQSVGPSVGADGAEQVLRGSEVRRHGPDAIRLRAGGVDASPMAGGPRFVGALSGAAAPLDVRDPDVVVALADAVAILGPDLRPRIMLGRLGAYAGFAKPTT